MNFFKNLFGKKKRIEKTDITRRFDLIGRIGQGSMSKVWRARDSKSGRTVALKVLDFEKTKRLESRFVGREKPTEGEIAVEFDHPNVVKTLEYGITTDREQFLVMEFIEGVSLSFLVDVQNEVMQKHRLNLVIQLGRAIEYLHKANWIHRDLCPRNVLVSSENEIKLIDFGLVVPNTPAFQAPGNRTGTATYMAPELIKRQPTDQRIDIFSYAVTSYEMYAGRLPWDYKGDTLESVVQTINSPPKPLRQFAPKIDERVESAIMRGLVVDPNRRWKHIGQMIAAIEEGQSPVFEAPADE